MGSAALRLRADPEPHGEIGYWVAAERTARRASRRARRAAAGTAHCACERARPARTDRDRRIAARERGRRCAARARQLPAITERRLGITAGAARVQERRPMRGSSSVDGSAALGATLSRDSALSRLSSAGDSRAFSGASSFAFGAARVTVSHEPFGFAAVASTITSTRSSSALSFCRRRSRSRRARRRGCGTCRCRPRRAACRRRAAARPRAPAPRGVSLPAPPNSSSTPRLA